MTWSPQSRLHRMATSVSTSSHAHFSLSFMTWSVQSRLQDFSVGFIQDVACHLLQSRFHPMVTSVSASGRTWSLPPGPRFLQRLGHDGLNYMIKGRLAECHCVPQNCSRISHLPVHEPHTDYSDKSAYV